MFTIGRIVGVKNDSQKGGQDLRSVLVTLGHLLESHCRPLGVPGIWRWMGTANENACFGMSKNAWF